nr:copper homeostasis protein CutC [Clostridia bacterium]
MAGILEICVDSLASARAAISGGADRLELCSALAVGGLTPYGELLKQIRQDSDIPIRCLMRPRAGDFLYTREELLLMAAQIETLRSLGADGFVIGCLTSAGELDAAAMTPLLQAAQGAGVTLHRCIDVSRDPCKTYLDAMALGIDTVLTSGAAGSCLQGMETIGKLLRLRDAHQGPEVLIGAGVNASVITAFRQAHPQARAFHMSGKTEIESGMIFRREGVPMGLPGLDEWHIQQTSVENIRAARAALDA